MADHDHDHEDDTRGEQTVTVEDAGPARKCLTIEIPAERIAKTLEDSFSHLKDDAQVPGFRKGRAPLRLIEKRFGSSVRQDVRGKIIGNSYAQAIKDENLEVIGEPDIDDLESVKLPDEGPLTFKVEIEVVPQFELPAMEGITVEKTNIEITDDNVQEELGRWCERFGKPVKVEDAKVQEKDYVMCDARILAGKDAKDDAEEIFHQPHAYTLVHGKDHDYKGHIAGILVEDLGKQLKGKQTGQGLSINMTGPQAHEDERIKDKPITIKLRIEAVERLELATIDDLAERMGVDSHEQVKTHIQRTLEQRHQAEQTTDMHEQVRQQLSDKIELELPEGLTNRQVEQVLNRKKMQLSAQQQSDHEIELNMAELRTTSEQDARQQLKHFFILTKVAKALEVEVTEAEVNGRIASMAVQRGRRPEKLRQELQRSGDLENLYLQIRHDKALDKIIEKANVVEKTASAEDADKSVKSGEETTKKKTAKKKAAQEKPKQDGK